MTKSANERVAIEVLTFLAQMYDEAADFKRFLRTKFAMANEAWQEPTSYIFCRKIADGVNVHIWIEAFLKGEDSLTWEVDINSQGEGWLIDARVCKVGESGTETIVQFPDLTVPDFATVQREVPALLRRLCQAGVKVMTEELSY